MASLIIIQKYDVYFFWKTIVSNLRAKQEQQEVGAPFLGSQIRILCKYGTVDTVLVLWELLDSRSHAQIPVRTRKK